MLSQGGVPAAAMPQPQTVVNSTVTREASLLQTVPTVIYTKLKEYAQNQQGILETMINNRLDGFATELVDHTQPDQ